MKILSALLALLVSLSGFAQTSGYGLTQTLREFSGSAAAANFEVDACIADIMEMRSSTIVGYDDAGKTWALKFAGIVAALTAGTLSMQNFKNALTASKKSLEYIKIASAENQVLRSQGEWVAKELSQAQAKYSRAYFLQIAAKIHEKVGRNVALTADEQAELAMIKSFKPEWWDEKVWQNELAHELQFDNKSTKTRAQWLAEANSHHEGAEKRVKEAVERFEQAGVTKENAKAASRSAATQAARASRFAGIGLSKAVAGGFLAFWIADAAITMPYASGNPEKFSEADIVASKNPKVMCTRAANGDAQEVKDLVLAWRQVRTKVWLVKDDGKGPAAPAPAAAGTTR